jgi:hypothetical protein
MRDIEVHLRQQHHDTIKCFQKPLVFSRLKKLHFLEHNKEYPYYTEH